MTRKGPKIFLSRHIFCDEILSMIFFIFIFVCTALQRLKSSLLQIFYSFLKLF